MGTGNILQYALLYTFLQYVLYTWQYTATHIVSYCCTFFYNMYCTLGNILQHVLYTIVVHFSTICIVHLSIYCNTYHTLLLYILLQYVLYTWQYTAVCIVHYCCIFFYNMYCRPFKSDFFCAVRIKLDQILRRVMHENCFQNL